METTYPSVTEIFRGQSGSCRFSGPLLRSLQPWTVAGDDQERNRSMIESRSIHFGQRRTMDEQVLGTDLVFLARGSMKCLSNVQGHLSPSSRTLLQLQP